MNAYKDFDLDIVTTTTTMNSSRSAEEATTSCDLSGPVHVSEPLPSLPDSWMCFLSISCED